MHTILHGSLFGFAKHKIGAQVRQGVLEFDIMEEKTLFNIERIKTVLKHNLFPLAMLPFILMLAFGLWYNQEGHSELVPGRGGYWDMRNLDFSQHIARLYGPVQYIPGALLTPEEFSERENEADVRSYFQEEHFGTSRIRLLFPDDGWYTFTRNSIHYSQRLFVNGEWRRDVGWPGTDSYSEIPDSARITFTVRPINGVVEIVQQSSNFVNHRFNQHQDWYIGSSQAVENQVRRVDFVINIILGCYFALFVVNTLMFFLMRGFQANLYFALSCLVWFLRSGAMEASVFTELFPWLGWSVKFRIEYMAIPAAITLTVAVIDQLFPNTLPKLFYRIVQYASLAFLLFCLLMNTNLVSLVMQWYMGAYIVAFFFIIVWMALRLRSINVSQGIFLAGLALLLYASIRDAFYFSNNIFLPPFESTYLSQIAMLIYVFSAMLSVSIAMRRQLDEASRKEQSLAVEKAGLERMNALKTDLMRTVSHELRTPLAVMMGFAQITAEKAKKSGMNEEIISSLNTIASEAERMASLVASMREAAMSKENVKDRKEISIRKVVLQTTGLYKKVLDRKGTELVVDVPENLPTVYSSDDEMVQVVFNLMRNADKATDHGRIQVTGAFEDNQVKITVSDNGAGIPPEILPKLFIRGVVGMEGGSGLGLPITKDIVEDNGGTIEVESVPGVGTDVTFSIPPYKENDK